MKISTLQTNRAGTIECFDEEGGKKKNFDPYFTPDSQVNTRCIRYERPKTIKFLQEKNLWETGCGEDL